MHFLRSRILEHLHNTRTCRSTDDGIINHDNTLAANDFTKNIQLNHNTRLSRRLLWLNEGSSHITVLDESRSVRNAGFQSKAHRCCITGLRYTHNDIGVDRMCLCQDPSGCNPGTVNADAIYVTVRSCEINVLKNTFCMTACHQRLVRRNSLRRDRHDLPRLHITDKLCANRIKCT